jgi:hypothetical protein
VYWGGLAFSERSAMNAHAAQPIAFSVPSRLDPLYHAIRTSDFRKQTCGRWHQPKIGQEIDRDSSVLDNTMTAIATNVWQPQIVRYVIFEVAELFERHNRLES